MNRISTANALKSLAETQSSSLTSTQNSPAAVQCRERYGLPAAFMQTFNPGRQTEFTVDIKRVYRGHAPSIACVAEAYGRDIAEAWLEGQIFDLANFSGVREKLTPAACEDLAKVILSQWGHLNVVELMHFFLRFKSGVYGRFYGTVDAMIITSALLDFGRERLEILQRLHAEEERIRRRREEEECKRNIEAFHASLRERSIDFDTWKMLISSGLTDEEITPEVIAAHTRTRTPTGGQ